jgi:hypothetical protein
VPALISAPYRPAPIARANPAITALLAP